MSLIEDLATSSAMSRHDRAHAGANPGGPPRSYRLDVGVEANTFHAMDIVIAKQRALPSAKTVKRHGHRDRNVDAYHAHLDLVGKRARRIAITGEDANPV